PGRTGNRHPTVAPYGVFTTADVPVIIAIGNEEIWRRFASLLDIDPDDPRYVTNTDRLSNIEELEAVINQRLTKHGAEEWLSLFNKSGIPAGEVRTLDRVYGSPQVLNQRLVCEVEHSTLGRIRLPGNPLRYSRSTLPPASAPPTLGQHTDEVRDRVVGPTA
ncbi:MAG TPA: CoA transferase, partial [Acidimicrobiales bacterium]|nr:CoA transferase [Acidimicrobiales bacterium]